MTLTPQDFRIVHDYFMKLAEDAKRVGRKHGDTVWARDVFPWDQNRYIVLVKEDAETGEAQYSFSPTQETIDRIAHDPATRRGLELSQPVQRRAQQLNLPDIETVSDLVHRAWMASKRAQGVVARHAEDGEELMVDYAKLSEKAKNLDRSTVRAVYAAIEAAGA